MIVSNPKPHLTVHDKEGKLVFDGEIDTPEQRAKVPPEVWQKVEPMLDKLAQNADHPAPPARTFPRHRPPILENPGPTPGGQPPTI